MTEPEREREGDRDNNLMFLSEHPRIRISEWIPFGTNNLVLLEEKLEAHDKLGECLLTAVLDDDPETTTVELDEPETRVTPTDGRTGEWIAFDAEVDYQATGGDHQVERFSTRVEASGCVINELELVESNGRRDRHSLDDLARVLADLVEDTSKMMGTLLNNFQRRLLDLVYCDQSTQRDKYVLVLTKKLTPERREVEAYFEEPGLLAELQQIIGRPFLEQAVTLEDGSQLIPGTNGAFFISDQPDAYSRVLAPCCCFLGIQSFLTNTFSRMWTTWDRLSDVKHVIRDQGIRKIMEIQDTIGELSGDISMFETILAYVKLSATEIGERVRAVREEPTDRERSLLNALKLGNQVEHILSRVEDAHLIVEGLEKEIESARELTQTLGEKETYRISQFMNVLTIVSVIVLPLTLITGVYGMNFQKFEPGTGKLIDPWAMPELYARGGYMVTLGIMALMVLVQVLYFRRKGLLGSR